MSSVLKLKLQNISAKLNAAIRLAFYPINVPFIITDGCILLFHERLISRIAYYDIRPVNSL